MDRLGTRPSEFWRALCAALIAAGREAYVIGDMGYEIRDEQYPVTGVRVNGAKWNGPPIGMSIGSQYGGVPHSKAHDGFYDVDALVWEFAERWDGLDRSLRVLTGDQATPFYRLHCNGCGHEQVYDMRVVGAPGFCPKCGAKWEIP